MIQIYMQVGLKPECATNFTVWTHVQQNKIDKQGNIYENKIYCT